jgi:hypothetical protein
VNKLINLFTIHTRRKNYKLAIMLEKKKRLIIVNYDYYEEFDLILNSSKLCLFLILATTFKVKQILSSKGYGFQTKEENLNMLSGQT